MRKSHELLLSDHFDVLMTKLEAFADHFEHLATTPEQRETAAAFNTFVGAFFREFSLHIDNLDRHAVRESEAESLWKEHGHDSLASLFSEIRADEAAGKREDAHWYGKEAFKNILGGKTETPAAEVARDKEIER